MIFSLLLKKKAKDWGAQNSDVTEETEIKGVLVEGGHFTVSCFILGKEGPHDETTYTFTETLNSQGESVRKVNGKLVSI